MCHWAVGRSTSSAVYDVLLIKILLFPGSGKLNWVSVKMKIEFHLSSIWKSYLGSILPSSVADRREILSLTLHKPYHLLSLIQFCNKITGQFLGAGTAWTLKTCMGICWCMCVLTLLCMWEYQILKRIHFGYNSQSHLSDTRQVVFSAWKEPVNANVPIGLEVLLLCIWKFDFYVKLIKLMSMKELCARILNSSCFLIFPSSLVLIILFLRFPFQFTKNLEM